MRYGVVFPYGDARAAADLAATAEAAGWDGFFVWEPVWGIDAWIQLTAAAMQTERIRLGTMLTPLSRMRPWDLAGKAATLDRLSGGRLILSVGLGAVDSGFAEFGEVTDRRIRAELLDEGLAIVTGLWQGQPFAFNGQHYRIQPTTFLPPPPPLQQPRIPIWVVGAWPSARSMGRAVRYDGLLPQMIQAGRTLAAGLAEVEAMHAYVTAHRPSSAAPYDIVVEGQTPGDHPVQAADTVRPWAQAGATWWLETAWDSLSQPDGAQAVAARVRQGPPRF